MTNTELFAFVILPLSVAALGWVVVFLNERFGNGQPRGYRRTH